MNKSTRRGPRARSPRARSRTEVLLLRLLGLVLLVELLLRLFFRFGSLLFLLEHRVGGVELLLELVHLVLARRVTLLEAVLQRLELFGHALDEVAVDVGRRRRRLDLVAQGVELVVVLLRDRLLFRLLLGQLLGADRLHPLGARDVHLLVARDLPDLRRDVAEEFGVVRDHEAAALELLDGRRERAERVAVEVVRGLVEHDEMRAEPHRCADDALDLLAAREVLHLAVGAELLVEPEVVQMLLDAVRRERLHVAGLGRDAVVDGLHELEEARVLQDHGGHVQVVLRVHARHVGHAPLDLVLVRAVARAAAHELLDGPRAVGEDAVDGVEGRRLLALLEGLHLLEDDLALARRVAGLVELGRELLEVDDEDLLELGLLLVRHLRGLHGLLLLVEAAREAPLDVLDGRHLEVLLDVVEGVLRDVGDAAILVAVDFRAAGVGLRLADEHLDQRGLARAVGADARDARRLGALHGAVDERRLARARLAVGAERLFFGRRVRERDVLGLDDGLGARLDALERAGHRERELHLRVVD
mmetsp:Transcript_8499/g.25395  ORF Transcript_8499/g.25395 Transcript_8499/m.25395 type:complete len:531 (-) Transcript_8499:501-2093(-)